jgi:hypothetical protein
MTAVLDRRRRACRAPAVPPTTRTHPPHAVVVGASLDGLAAAHVLGHHLERVTLVERDDLPDRVAPRTGRRPLPYIDALRRVLDSPQVVVRAGLEAVGLSITAGRVDGVEVCSRRVVATAPAMVIAADLVVDAGEGATVPATTPRPDGLVVIGSAARPSDGGRSPWDLAPDVSAAVLGRCLAEHLRRGPDLIGFSARAQRALAQAGAGAPAAR